MTKYINNKRVCARGVTFINNDILLMERYKKDKNEIMHYYTVPGGGVEEDESNEIACIREINEETTVDAKILEYLGKEEYDTGIVYWYLTKYISGTPKLGGEELERNNPDNFYKVVLINYNEIDKCNFLGKTKEYIIKAKEVLDEKNKI